MRKFWRALAAAKLYPPDRLTLAVVFTVALGIAVTEGRGLLSPFYALLWTVLAAAMAWGIDALAKAHDRA